VFASPVPLITLLHQRIQAYFQNYYRQPN
jgi:hypothetical protein